jgi:hypothetical protein
MTGRHGGNEHEFNQEKRRRIQKRIRWCAACFRSAINAMIIKSKDFFSQVGARPGPAQYNDVGWFRPFSNRQGSTDCYLVDRIFQDRGGRQGYTCTNVVDIGFRVIPLVGCRESYCSVGIHLLGDIHSSVADVHA